MVENKKKHINMISVVIPTMNRYNSLKKTLDTIMNCKVQPDQVIVIDQTRDKNIAQSIKNMVESLSLDSLYVQADNPSLTKARNIGMTFVNNEIVIQMDDDVDVKNDTFQIIKEKMKDQQISMIAGIDENYNIGKNIGGYIFAKKSFAKRRKGYITKSIYGRFPAVDYTQTGTEWAMGYFFVIRKSCHDRWKMSWDEKLIGYAYAEDLDYSYRYYLNAKDENKKCILTKEVIVRHYNTKEWRIMPKKRTYMVVLNREYIRYKLFKTKHSFLLMIWSNIGEMCKRLLGKDSFRDFIRVQFYCINNIKDIRAGNIRYDI